MKNLAVIGTLLLFAILGVLAVGIGLQRSNTGFGLVIARNHDEPVCLNYEGAHVVQIYVDGELVYTGHTHEGAPPQSDPMLLDYEEDAETILELKP